MNMMSGYNPDRVLFKCPFCKCDFIQKYVEDFEVWNLYAEGQTDVDCIECGKEIILTVSCTEFEYVTDEEE